MDSQLNGILTPSEDTPENVFQLNATLPIPDENDDLQTVAKKMEDLAAAITRGENIALATGFKALTHPEHNPIARARNTMTSEQAMQYDAWSKGFFIFPLIDWEADTEAIPIEVDALVYMEKRAQALNEIYGVKIATAENALWFTQKHEGLLPCLDAVAKVQCARRALNKAQTELYGMELAEIQVIHRAKAAAKRVMTDVFQRYNDLNARINASREIIDDRCEAVKVRASVREQERKDAESLKRTAATAATSQPVTDMVLHRGTRNDRIRDLFRRVAEAYPTTQNQPDLTQQRSKERKAREKCKYNLRTSSVRGRSVHDKTNTTEVKAGALPMMKRQRRE